MAIAAARRKPPSPGVHPRIPEAQIEALESKLEQLADCERFASQR